MKRNKRAVGTQYEEKAVKFLTDNGIHIICKNFRCKQGEIDIIGTHEDCLVFTEVKYRRTGQKGTPEDAVGISKQKRICGVAEYFLYTHQHYYGYMVRYDVVAIEGEDIRWYQNAFEHVRI